MLKENTIRLTGTLDKDVCVFCTKGRMAKVDVIKKLLAKNTETEDKRHEVVFLKDTLETDRINDTCISVPSSIVVKGEKNKELAEFDGIIIYPMRKSGQVVFLEAKNMSQHPGEGKKKIIEKFKKLGIEYSDDSIEIVKCDARMKYSV